MKIILTIYRQILARLFYIVGFPLVLTEGIIQNPRQPFLALRQLWTTLLFLAELGELNDKKRDTNYS